MEKQRLLVLVAVAGFVLAGSSVAAYIVLRSDKQTPAPGGPFDVHTAPEPSEREQISGGTAMLVKLPGDLAADRLTALSPEALANVSKVKELFPPQSSVIVDEASWRRTGTVASVIATVLRQGEAEPRTYLVLLARTGQQWTLSDVYVQRPAPPSQPSAVAT